jgi:hypothetical protein
MSDPNPEVELLNEAATAAFEVLEDAAGGDEAAAETLWRRPLCDCTVYTLQQDGSSFAEQVNARLTQKGLSYRLTPR